MAMMVVLSNTAISFSFSWSSFSTRNVVCSSTGTAFAGGVTSGSGTLWSDDFLAVAMFGSVFKFVDQVADASVKLHAQGIQRLENPDGGRAIRAQADRVMPSAAPRHAVDDELVGDDGVVSGRINVEQTARWHYGVGIAISQGTDAPLVLHPQTINHGKNARHRTAVRPACDRARPFCRARQRVEH